MNRPYDPVEGDVGARAAVRGPSIFDHSKLPKIGGLISRAADQGPWFSVLNWARFVRIRVGFVFLMTTVVPIISYLNKFLFLNE